MFCHFYSYLPKSVTVRYVIFALFCFSIFLTSTHSHAQDLTTTETKPQKESQSGYDVDFFPVPVIENSPDEGTSYGLLPITIFTNKQDNTIDYIVGGLAQWTNITKWSGAGIAYWYPNAKKNPDEVLAFYAEIAQRYYREVEFRYFNPRLNNKFYIDAYSLFLKTPFRRFYGYGAQTTRGGQSNYTSRNFLTDLTFGYYFNRSLRLNIKESFTTTDLLTKAFNNTTDTLTRYGGQDGVFDSTHLIHELSLTFDNRPNGENSFKGSFAEVAYFGSIKNFLSDTSFQGFRFQALHMLPLIDKKLVSVFRFNLRDQYGSNMPFYLQSTLGGRDELRSFIPNRFTDTGKILFTYEQRIRVWSPTFAGTKVHLHVDPFVEVGRVFHHINNLGFDNYQANVGLGFRAFVPPNVLARVDVAYGSEGYSVYTTLGYPF